MNARVGAVVAGLLGVVAMLLIVSSFGSGSGATKTEEDAIDRTSTTTTSAPETSTTAGPSSSVATTTTTTVAPSTTEVVAPPEGLSSDPELAAILDEVLRDPVFANVDTSATVWRDNGEVYVFQPELELLPASNQKLLTASGVLDLLPADFAFHTTIHLDPNNNLVVVAGGDPTVTSRTLAGWSNALFRGGITGVNDVIVDARRYDSERMAPGWSPDHVPNSTGPLSAFIVDDNRHRTDANYLSAPDQGNGELFVDALRAAGVVVTGGARVGELSAGSSLIANFSSPSRDALVGTLLRSSDNEIAEALVRELGYQTSGEGTTSAGLLVLDAITVRLGLDFAGQAGDGSGLSRADRRSTREWVQLLVAVQDKPWWPIFDASLPVAAQSGTLGNRLGDPATAGNVRAKTGTLDDSRALSGYLTDGAGRPVVFSIIVNGVGASAARNGIDRFVTALASFG